MSEQDEKPFQLVRLGLHNIEYLPDKFQSRAAQNIDKVREYSVNIEKWIETCPIVVFLVAGVYYLVDGFHRFNAWERRLAADPNFGDICCKVYEGMPEDAVLYAVKANRGHTLESGGIPLVEDDRKKAACMLFEGVPRSREWSATKIGKECGVSPMTAGLYLEKFCQENGYACSEFCTDERGRMYPRRSTTPEKRKTRLRNAPSRWTRADGSIGEANRYFCQINKETFYLGRVKPEAEEKLKELELEFGTLRPFVDMEAKSLPEFPVGPISVDWILENTKTGFGVLRFKSSEKRIVTLGDINTVEDRVLGWLKQLQDSQTTPTPSGNSSVNGNGQHH